jgi:hypothetical protein
MPPEQIIGVMRQVEVDQAKYGQLAKIVDIWALG